MYDTFLFLHLVGVIAWIGGGFTLTILSLRLAHEPSAEARGALSRSSAFFGRKVFGPAAGLTLIAGIVMVALIGGTMTVWIIWGLCGLVLSGFVGSVLVGRTARKLADQLSHSDTGLGPAQNGRLRQRLILLSTVDLLILLSVVWAMVFKP